MTPRRLQFSTRAWFQWWVLPAIALVTIGLSWGVYRSLREAILRGFDQKLVAVSTTTAAFIDPEAHVELMYQPRLTGLAFIDDEVLLGLDGSRNVLMRLRAGNGVADPATVKVPGGLSQLAFDARSAQLLALDRAAGRLVGIDPASGSTETLIDLDDDARASALVALPDGPVLVLANTLLRADLRRGRVSRIGETDLPALLAAAYHPKHDAIFAITSDHRLLRIDPRSGAVSPGPELSPDQPLESLVYHPGHDVLWAVGARLVTLDPDTGELAPAQVVAALGKEIGPLYRRYVTGMRRLMNQLDLTYVYTQVVENGSEITYGLDATQGDEHSPLHSLDELPAEQVAGVEELMRSGAVYTSPVQQWQQWGLIKSAFAPILDASGRAVAMAGADVDVTLIEQQTRGALFQLFIVGALSLVLATAVSFMIADRLRRPLALIKSTALQVAAGDYRRRAEVAAPQEARVLAATFNGVAAALETSLAALHSSIAELLRNRDRYELGRRLSQPHEPAHVLRDVDGIRATWRDPLRAPDHASGAARFGSRVVIWLAKSPPDRLEAARRRADLALRVAARLGASDAEGRAVPLPGQTLAPFAERRLPPALPAGVILAVDVDTERRVARMFRGTEAPLVERSPDGTHRLVHEELLLEFSGYEMEVFNA